MTRPRPWGAAIADDEPLAREVIRNLLADERDLCVVAEFEDGFALDAYLSRTPPDVLFLDIEMPGRGGMEVLHEQRSVARPVAVLVTAYEHFALPAFDLDVADYLLKPFSDARFRAALARVRRRLTAERATPPRTRFLARLGSDGRTIPVGNVRWIEARDYCVRLHAVDGPHLVRLSLARLEAELDPTTFVRIHRQALVNLAHVIGVRRLPSGADAIVLHDGTTLPISERRRADVLSRLGAGVPPR